MLIIEEQYDVVFIIEDTVSCREDFSTIYNSYILPSVRFFNNGINPAEVTIFGSQRQPSQYSLLTLQNQFRQDVGMNPGKITQNASDFLMKIKNLRFTNGGIASGCFLSEALATALQVFESMSALRNSMHVVKHVVIITNTAPFMTPVIKTCPYNGFSFDELLDVFNKKSVCISVFCGRHILPYKDIFRKLYPDFANIFSKSAQYAIHANHMILIKGIQLPVQDVVDVDVFALNKIDSKLDADINTPNKKIKLEGSSTNNVINNSVTSQVNLQPIQTSQQFSLQQVQLQQVQLQQVQSQQNQPTNQISVCAPNVVTLQQQQQQQQQQTQLFQRKVVWSGQLQWNETNLSGDGGKISRILPCKATVNPNDILQTNDWPTDLHMQLIPQQYLQNLARFVKQAKQVMFTFSTSDNEVLQSMYRIMNGSPASGIPGTTGQKFAGCVFLNNPSDQPHVKVLLLIFSPKKKAFIGVIPEEQQQFVGELRAIISEDKSRTVKQQVFPSAPAQPQTLRNLPVSSSNQQFTQQQFIARQQMMQQYQKNSQLKYLLQQQQQQQIQFQQPNQQLQQQAQLQQQTQLTQPIQQQTQFNQTQMTQINQQLQQSQQMQLQAQNSRINQKWSNQQLQQQILLQQQQQTQQQQQQQQQQLVALALAQQQEQQQTCMSDVQIYNEFLGSG